MAPPTIRPGGETDIAAVLGLWRAGGEPGFSDRSESLAALLRTDAGALLLAEREKVLLGTLIAAWDGWRGSFYRLVVDREHRRQGIATMLVRAGERHLRELGATRLTALIATGDASAHAFWESAGYGHQRDRVRYIRTAGD